ncbi:mitogen-activated protein kinase kinase [Malassezia yamatoensis]|uniref:Mitogen-activated protein kinase kinase n=1 Tax=Malassezia yamatoensis TaxID=253288 RepID=A0AAJ5Z2P5_9BASI|nr:mitogen-activated protein kinase kinase [Malassezia yamatoensis]
MASLIPPRQRPREGVPKLTLPIISKPDDPSQKPEDSGQVEEPTIMPIHSHVLPGEDAKDQKDELQDMVRRVKIFNDKSKQVNRLSLGSLNANDLNLSEETKARSSEVSTAAGLQPNAMQRTVSAPDYALMEPQSLLRAGDLEVLESLGEGASGEVAKARIKSTGLIIARKTIVTSPDPVIHRQLLRELNVNQSCRSEYIVQYYGAFFEPDNAIITICMEFCEGGSMDAIYRCTKARGGRIGEKILIKLAGSIIHGLDYLYEKRIIHRDVKPSNILVTREGLIKLCDFGVAGELIDSVAGTFTGTSSYMAPERIMGHPYNVSSDVWSLGITVLELAMNRFPFAKDNQEILGPIDFLTTLLNEPLPRLEDELAHNIKWSRALRDFLDRCLVREGTARATPRALLHHPVVKRSEAIPNSDMARFIAMVWRWPPPT